MSPSSTETRCCSACRTVKSMSEFYATSWLCRPCQKAYDATRKKRNPNPSNHTPAARARKRRWRDANVEKFSLQLAARVEVRNAVASGKLVRRYECEECGKKAVRKDGVTAVQAHHDDYTKPLAVRWLCARCHSDWHLKNDAAMAEGADR